MSKPEFEINESFQHGSQTLKCIDNPDKKALNPCVKCSFANLACWNMTDSIGECEATKRKDEKNVIFVEVEEAK